MTPINALCLIIGCAVGSAVVALITRKRIKPTRKREIKRLAKQVMEKIDHLTKNWPAGEYTITFQIEPAAAISEYERAQEGK